METEANHEQHEESVFLTPETPEIYNIRTLADLGPQLPIGHKGTGDNWIRDLAHRRWNVRVEKEISKLREANRTINEAKFASMLMSHVYTKIGAIAYDGGAVLEKKGKNRSNWFRALAQIGDMYQADVLYAYVFLRHQVMGNVLDMQLGCVMCGHQAPFQADLSTLEVRVPKDPREVTWEFALTEPFPVRGKQCEGFVLGPAKWNAIEAMQLAGQLDSAAAKSALVWGSIRGLLPAEQFTEVVIAEHELDEMGKRDFERACGAIDKNAFGPDMAIEVACPKCKAENRISLDWRYESFFGTSGRSEAFTT